MGDRIPVGIVYQRDDVPPYEEHVPALKREPWCTGPSTRWTKSALPR